MDRGEIQVYGTNARNENLDPLPKNALRPKSRYEGDAQSNQNSQSGVDLLIIICILTNLTIFCMQRTK